MVGLYLLITCDIVAVMVMMIYVFYYTFANSAPARFTVSRPLDTIYAAS